MCHPEFIWQPKLQTRLPVSRGLGLEPRKCGLLVQALKYFTKLALQGRLDRSCGRQNTNQACFPAIDHLRKSKGAFSLSLSQSMVTWIGICTQWFTLPSVREGIEKLSFPKIWAPEAPELDCLKVFLRIEGPEQGCLHVSLERLAIAWLRLGISAQSLTARCWHREGRAHASGWVVRAIVESPGSTAGTPPRFFWTVEAIEFENSSRRSLLPFYTGGLNPPSPVKMSTFSELLGCTQYLQIFLIWCSHACTWKHRSVSTGSSGS